MAFADMSLRWTGWVYKQDGEQPPFAFRRRERATLRFRQMKALQKFASVHASIHNHLSLERHLIDGRPLRRDAQPHWRSGGSAA